MRSAILALLMPCSLAAAAEMTHVAESRALGARSAFIEFAANAVPSGGEGPKLPSARAAPPVGLKVLGASGDNDFSLAYVLQALTYQLITTGDPSLAKQIVDRGDAMLAERNATTDRGKPFGWFDRSSGVDRPYAWGGFTGHNFAPLMHFAQIVLSNPALGQKVYNGRAFRDYAIGYMNEFKVALQVHSSNDLVQQQGFSYFKLPSDVPVRSRTAPGSPYPPNMNAAMFSSILHLSCAEERLGTKEDSLRHRRLVDGFVSFMKDRVLTSAERNGRETLVWDYSSYIKRREDVGHANNVIRFLVEAHEAGYAVDGELLRRIANTVDLLMQPDGTVQSDLIDGTNYPARLAHSVYYFILLGRYSESIKAKVAAIRNASNIFAYQGTAQYVLSGAHILDRSCSGRPA
ncbi:hypothetical protein [Bradyrhizobium brasilense]|uniref:D-glucuronyl C5-epimerase C-terminal domain-containing protein n=2 Tax=Bradyrhizobium TaxID=374 RepID=A0ABY8JP23_9BRAD|nr:hypothetical protein [Bradyrhizobium brasilense]WFU66863.1 hypothetical protein QA636_15795 [Bradyrhizobium brasilense]